MGENLTDQRVADLPRVSLAEHLTTQEVADLFRTSPETVRYWRHVGKGPRSFKVGRRVLYAREHVEAFIREVREPGAVA